PASVRLVVDLLLQRLELLRRQEMRGAARRAARGFGRRAIDRRRLPAVDRPRVLLLDDAQAHAAAHHRKLVSDTLFPKIRAWHSLRFVTPPKEIGIRHECSEQWCLTQMCEDCVERTPPRQRA